MLLQILAHTPAWVFAIFALLLWLGSRQWRANRVGLVRVALLPLAMGVFAVWGLRSSFGESVGMPAALAAWAAAALLLAVLVLRRPLPAGTRYDAAARSFDVAGSPVPLALMMGIFFTKYAVGVQLAMHPELARHGGFVLAIATLYGAFSGIFAARALRLWRLAARPQAQGSFVRPA